MKSGANLNDVNRINEMYAEGLTAEEISEELKIVLSCVASFDPEPELDGEDEDEIED